MSLKGFLLLLVMWFGASAQACEAPTVEEAHAFFTGHTEWILVDGQDSNLESLSPEVSIQLDYLQHANSVIMWNGGPANVRGLQVCKTEQSHVMTLKSNWPRVKITRLGRGRIQAKALGIRFYLLPAPRVIAQ